MDWKGLLNWTLKYQDGTVNNDLKPLSEEDTKFIEAAFESICVNEMKEIMKILDKLKEPEINTEDEIKSRLDLLEDLLSLIDGPENARNIVRAKRFPEIINYFFSTKSKPIKLQLGSIITSMMQNDKLVQTAAIELGMFKILGDINTCDDPDLSAKYIYILTGLLYGEYEGSKRTFIDEFDGMKLIHNLLIKHYPNNEVDSKKFSTFKRILGIVKELTKLEEKEAENYSIRLVALKSMEKIHLQDLLLEILIKLVNEEGVKGGFKSHDNIDSIKLLLEIIGNISILFETGTKTLTDILNILKDINAYISETESSILTDEEKKEEKNFIIEVIKNVKSDFGIGIQSQININTQENTSNTNNALNSLALVESNDQIAKGSVHLQLK